VISKVFEQMCLRVEVFDMLTFYAMTSTTYDAKYMSRYLAIVVTLDDHVLGVSNGFQADVPVVDTGSESNLSNKATSSPEML